MQVYVLNRQSAVRVNPSRLRRLLRYLLPRALRSRKTETWHEAGLVLVNDADMRRMNLRCFRRHGTTDVITFRYPPQPGICAGWSGEILVNVGEALRVGARRGGEQRELALYVAHGCDHLADADDETPAGYGRMRRRELRWLREAAARRLTDGLLAPCGARRSRAERRGRGARMPGTGAPEGAR